MADIRQGMIGVNTADDRGQLLQVMLADADTVTVRPLDSYKWQVLPLANFWPLISKLNIGE